jgi:GT2 family glycosyltransferase
MPPAPDISLCIAVYRAHDAPNVASIAAQLPAALGDRTGELVVALNGIDVRAAGVPEGVRTVPLPVNRGVAPGWNAAASVAAGTTLVIANDDVGLGPACLQRLHDTLVATPDAGVVGPAATAWDIAGAAHREALDVQARPAGELVPCEVVSGFLFATTRAVYEEVGGFDDAYAPCSWEEVDYCTAVRAGGRRCYGVAGVDVEHEWGISRRAMPWKRVAYDGRSETLRSIHRRNRRHFQEKWSAHPIAGSPA